MLNFLAAWAILSIITAVVVCRFIHVSKIKQGDQS